MGIRPGGTIVLVADVTLIAWAFRKAGQRFQVAMLLDAFLDHLGDQGTLAIPTFNFDLKANDRFDILHTPTISGALGQAALSHPAFMRTPHPLHSFAVAGAQQQAFLQADDPSSFGERSSFALLHGLGAQVLAIGMPLEPAFTYVHFVEESMGVPYRRWRNIPIIYTDHSGTTSKRIFKLYAKRPGHVNDFKALEPLLKSAEALTSGEVDGSHYLIADLQKAHAVIEGDILHNRARSIVQFKWKWWLRDLLRPLIKRNRPSRSALMMNNDAARPH
jgi:aminoglycoside 3-N-acetyltransferase